MYIYVEEFKWFVGMTNRYSKNVFDVLAYAMLILLLKTFWLCELLIDTNLFELKGTQL